MNSKNQFTVCTVGTLTDKNFIEMIGTNSLENNVRIRFKIGKTSDKKTILFS